MQPAPPAPSSLQVTGLPVQDVCLHSMQAPTNPVLQTSSISGASHCTYKTVAKHSPPKPGLSKWISVSLVRADSQPPVKGLEMQNGPSRITLGFSLWDIFPL